MSILDKIDIFHKTYGNWYKVHSCYYYNKIKVTNFTMKNTNNITDEVNLIKCFSERKEDRNREINRIKLILNEYKQIS